MFINCSLNEKIYKCKVYKCYYRNNDDLLFPIMRNIVSLNSAILCWDGLIIWRNLLAHKASTQQGFLLLCPRQGFESFLSRQCNYSIRNELSPCFYLRKIMIWTNHDHKWGRNIMFREISKSIILTWASRRPPPNPHPPTPPWPSFPPSATPALTPTWSQSPTPEWTPDATDAQTHRGNAIRRCRRRSCRPRWAECRRGGRWYRQRAEMGFN